MKTFNTEKSEVIYKYINIKKDNREESNSPFTQIEINLRFVFLIPLAEYPS